MSSIEWDPEKGRSNQRKRSPFDLGAESDRERAASLPGRIAMKEEYDFSKGKRGPILPTPPGKERITIRLDVDILDWFRQQVEDQGGGNYQTMINQALREYILNRNAVLEDLLRRVVRDEFEQFKVVADQLAAEWRESGESLESMLAALREVRAEYHSKNT
jgi:uncharacterized protein (DUF4415 family)